MLIFSECDVTWVGRPAERRYQLAAQKRNDTALKFDYYVETANYFERESGKAKQFNSWNVDKIKPTHWENIKKLEALQKRQSQLQDLLRAENEVYKCEIEELRSRKNAREETTLEALKEKLRQKRTELSLYHPRTCRRIQSYFSYPTKEDREIIKELTTSVQNRPSRKSLENTNLRNEMQSSDMAQDSPQRKKTAQVDYTNLVDQANFNIRHQEFMDNRAASNRSNFGTLPEQKYADDGREKSDDRDSSGRSSAGSYERSDFLDHGPPPEGWNLPKKFAERYAKQSLQETNVHETGGPNVKPNGTEEDYPDNGTAVEHSGEDDVHERSIKEEYISAKMESMAVHPNSVENRGSDQKWIPKTSETLLMYLTHQEIKKKIEDLESREVRAMHKQSWEEALRLKDMKNRLELFRDKQFYLRDDINIDPELKQLALQSIEARNKQITNRAEFYQNSQMYSEEAKLMWNMWNEEDKRHAISDEKAQRDLLLRQLGEEWEVLQQEEKQKIYLDYMQIMTESFSQHEMELLSKLTQQKY